MYGIVHATKENAYVKREQMKAELEKEYRRTIFDGEALWNL